MLTFIIVARNEGRYLPDAFADFLAQDYPRGRIEFLFVDGVSRDDSLKQAEAFKAAHKDVDFVILTNPKLTLASGWNVALARAKGRIILRIDAHARMPADFIRRNIEAVSEGHEIVGGPAITKRYPDGLLPEFIAIAEASRFGGSAAAFRNQGRAGYIDTLAFAAYKREVFVNAGGYNEMLDRTEDNEIHYRMARAGYRFWFDPKIRSEYFPRRTLGGLLNQKFGNGYSVAIASAISPGCFRLRHFVPFIFFAALCGAAVLALAAPGPFYLLLAVYFGTALFFTAKAVEREPARIILLSVFMPLLFLAVHCSYGSGTLCGILTLPFKWNKLRSYRPPCPVSAQGALPPDGFIGLPRKQ